MVLSTISGVHVRTIVSENDILGNARISVVYRIIHIHIIMEWSELYKDLNKLKSDFDKSYKSLTQNRSIQQATINKHAEILVTRFNNARY